MAPLLAVLVVTLAALGAGSILAGVKALRRARPVGFGLRTLGGLLLFSLGGLVAAIGAGLHGYRALTREVVAARIDVRPIGERRFQATVHIPDRPDATYELVGDQIYVDARILKWKPLVNVLGLHTAYDLDRIAGRYEDIDQELDAGRTVYSLTGERWVDLFDLRRRFAVLSPFLDAEYGSGTFVSVRRPAELEVLVSTSGLLVREVEAGR